MPDILRSQLFSATIVALEAHALESLYSMHLIEKKGRMHANGFVPVRVPAFAVSYPVHTPVLHKFSANLL